MTDEEITAMVEETAAFNEWNAEEQPNNDFLISPADLPDPAAAPDWTKGDVDGVTVYRGETELSGVGMYSVLLRPQRHEPRGDGVPDADQQLPDADGHHKARR